MVLVVLVVVATSIESLGMGRAARPWHGLGARACAPMHMRPKAAVIEPEPLMMPVTVPSERVLPPIDGCSARSAATAEVMMLLGPPTRMPMMPRSRRSKAGGIVSE